MTQRRYVRIFLLVPALITLYFVFQIFQPFLEPIALAAILGTLSYPLYTTLRRWLKGRTNLAALLSTVVITATIVLPFVFLTVSLVQEVGSVYGTFQAKVQSGDFDQLLDPQENEYIQPVLSWVGQYIDLEDLAIGSRIAQGLQQASLFFLKHTTQWVGGFFQIISQFFIMIITLFFLFRDGGDLVRRFRGLTPLTRRYEDVLSETLREITRATVLGSLLTSLAQGLAGGIIFWALGISNVIIWAALVALFSLVPVVGSSLVWGPWVIYFLATGSIWRGVILALLAVFVIGLIDNIVRPLFIEGRAGMHTLLVFFSIMGGIAYFGITGMIFGPIIVSLGLTFLRLYQIEFEEELAKPK